MYIVKGSVNKVALTLSEKATGQNSEWLIKLTNSITGEKTEKVFAVYDLSNFPRANIFNITESVNEDLGNGTVSLSPSGEWSYIAYEMASSSPRNLDPNDALGIVETGVCVVFDPTESQKVFFDEEDNKNNAVFDEP